MWRNFKHFAKSGALFLAVFVGVPLVLAGIANVSYSRHVTCTETSIPYEAVTVYDQTKSTDYDSTTYGETGTLETCVNGYGTEVSRTVTSEKVDEVHTIGTKAETDTSEQDDYPSSVGGAICRDGYRSYSTGSGTCSWHDGVAQWLY